MMKKKLFFLGLVLLFSMASFAQITVESCYEKAELNYPLIKQYGLIEKTKEYNLSNANKGYLPQVAFLAKATYQSDVVQLPIDFAQLGLPKVNIPTLAKDQYGATIDVNQTVWDGGAIQLQKESIRASATVDQKNMDVTLYAIRERVNQLYFGILLVDAQIRQNQLLQAELNRKLEQVRVYLQNGMANQADVDAIRVDLLKSKQNDIQFIYTKKAYVEMLSQWIGEPLNVDSAFVKPEPIRPATSENNRPELTLFDAQIQELEVRNREITSGLMPKLGLFITGGYGKPGLNMLENSFSAYYIGGLKLSWSISPFYTLKDKRNKIQTNIRAIHTQRETFLFNTRLSVTQTSNAIHRYFEQLKYDNEMIALRNSVKRASEAKMANGTLSGTDLVRDVHAEQMAIQDKIIHEMDLLLAIYNLKFATNN